MKMPTAYSPARGQTALEYLLLLAVVAVVVIASFGPGSLISQIHDAAQSYYNTITSVIMGRNPNPINGGWCPVTCPRGSGPNVIYGACECPAPAFGGAPCPGVGTITACGAGQTCKGFEVSCSGVSSCGPCPTGQVCLPPDGHCGCANGLDLVCGQPPTPKGSIAGADCTQCICPLGTTYNKSSNSCDQICTAPCTTWNGTACVPVTCPANMWCNPDAPPNKECQCWKNYCWNGTQCVYGSSCTCTPKCNGKFCGDDGCGGSCGSCPSSGETCTSGQCIATYQVCNAQFDVCKICSGSIDCSAVSCIQPAICNVFTTTSGQKCPGAFKVIFVTNDPEPCTSGGVNCAPGGTCGTTSTTTDCCGNWTKGIPGVICYWETDQCL